LAREGEIVAQPTRLFVDDEEGGEVVGGEAFCLDLQLAVPFGKMVTEEVGEAGAFGFAIGVQKRFFAGRIEDCFVELAVDALKMQIVTVSFTVSL